MKLRMIPLAQREMLRAARRYDGKAEGLGTRFLDEIRVGLMAILEFPAAHPKIAVPYRRKLVTDFPYSIIYRVDADEIVIVALANFKRRPGYWRRRARS
jgi:plasmid stabilization system protein ParE